MSFSLRLAPLILLAGAGCATASGSATTTIDPVQVQPQADQAAPGPVAQTVASTEPTTPQPRAVFEGLASWYGPGFHGRQTANGEIFDENVLSAAHLTLPLPSLARVTRLDTGQSVMVRVNDRGPYIDGRIIDLSRAAAEALGFIEDGLAEVRVESFGPADPEDRAARSGFFDPSTGAASASRLTEAP